MATHYAARWRPQIGTGALSTVISGSPGDPGNPPTVPATEDTQARTERLQLVVYDDTEVGPGLNPPNPYRPGDPATETKLAIVDEVPLTQMISAFAGKTEAQAQAIWDAARDAQITTWQNDPQIMAKVRAARGAYRSPFVIIA